MLGGALATEDAGDPLEHLLQMLTQEGPHQMLPLPLFVALWAVLPSPVECARLALAPALRHSYCRPFYVSMATGSFTIPKLAAPSCGQTRVRSKRSCRSVTSEGVLL